MKKNLLFIVFFAAVAGVNVQAQQAHPAHGGSWTNLYGPQGTCIS